MKLIPLTKGLFAKVDDADFDCLMQWKWHTTAWGYAARTFRKPNGRQSTIHMHRQILGTPPGFHTDHANSDKLDNQRGNIRVATASLNGGNRKPATGRRFKGVIRNTRDRKFRAEIIHQKKRIRLGSFQTEIEAATAYNEASRRLFGSFARLNEIPSENAP